MRVTTETVTMTTEEYDTFIECIHKLQDMYLELRKQHNEVLDDYAKTLKLIRDRLNGTVGDLYV